MLFQDVGQCSVGKRLQMSRSPLMSAAWSQGAKKRGGFIRKRNSVLTGQDGKRRPLEVWREENMLNRLRRSPEILSNRMKPIHGS